MNGRKYVNSMQRPWIPQRLNTYANDWSCEIGSWFVFAFKRRLPCYVAGTAKLEIGGSCMCVQQCLHVSTYQITCLPEFVWTMSWFFLNMAVEKLAEWCQLWLYPSWVCVYNNVCTMRVITHYMSSWVHMNHELSLPGRGVAVEKLTEATNCNSTLVRSSVGHRTM